MPRLHLLPASARHAGPLSYAYGRCALGRFIVALGKHGLCAVLIGDEERALLAELRTYFPLAHPQENPGDFRHALPQLATHLDQPWTPFPLQLEAAGTPLQQRVWQTLCAIPAGQTRSYTQLARSLGLENAVRAVANACAANRLAVVVPCHRILRSDSTISGYRWGPARKAMLLERERHAPCLPT
ncbi:methylated-DNA--[protein]-cysteine S-methyltransferase [Azoarcus sp. TTM-91]|uniref:methylated-DNA--[protein]-cysteine S-methyltransferase n=1 Tax=Azoarcus sp. TTM-91 TaxID=2691581 RepID=UPI00145F86CF|nr:methylated-DNA--[protein]-cysteine S-methyltransferase [Azoarcus sp. TTM-91]NMG32844.1 methylated-DNA--[protein]-cysteine S-methyltransferase [Azoarcus sp. TTM-91]